MKDYHSPDTTHHLRLKMSKLIILLLVFSACQNGTPVYKTVQQTPFANPDTVPVPELTFDLSPSERVLWVNGKANEGDTIWVWNAWSHKYRKNMTHVGKSDPRVEFSQRYIYKK